MSCSQERQLVAQFVPKLLDQSFQEKFVPSFVMNVDSYLRGIQKVSFCHQLDGKKRNLTKDAVAVHVRTARKRNLIPQAIEMFG